MSNEISRPQLNVGDIVGLKSGGPKMTVSEFWVDSAGELFSIGVTWFNGGNEVKSSFKMDCLEVF